MFRTSTRCQKVRQTEIQTDGSLADRQSDRKKGRQTEGQTVKSQTIRKAGQKRARHKIIFWSLEKLISNMALDKDMKEEEYTHYTGLLVESHPTSLFFLSVTQWDNTISVTHFPRLWKYCGKNW